MSDRTATVQERIAEKFNPAAVQDMTASSGGIVALIPDSFGQLMEFSKLMATTTAVPPHLRGKPGDCLAVAMQAMRWGMDPFAVAAKSYFVNDRLAYEAQLVNAVLYARAPLEGRLKIDFKGVGDALVCHVTGKLVDDPNPHTVEQEIKTITTRNSPLWKQAPRQQLGYFTTRMWARLYAPEVLLGVYTREELEEGHIGPDRAKDITPRPQRGNYGAAGAQPVTGEIVDDEPEPREPYTLVNEVGEVVEEVTGAGTYADALIHHIGRIKDTKALATLWENNADMVERMKAEGKAAHVDSITSWYAQREEEIAEAARQDAQPEPQETPADEPQEAIPQEAMPQEAEPVTEPDGRPAPPDDAEQAEQPDAAEADEALADDALVVPLTTAASGNPDWITYYKAMLRKAREVGKGHIGALQRVNANALEQMAAKSKSNFNTLHREFEKIEAAA